MPLYFKVTNIKDADPTENNNTIYLMDKLGMQIDKIEKIIFEGNKFCIPGTCSQYVNATLKDVMDKKNPDSIMAHEIIIIINNKVYTYDILDKISDKTHKNHLYISNNYLRIDND